MLKKQTVLQASIFLTATILLNRLIGFLREIIIARSFGAGEQYDTYLVAVTFPLMIYSLLFYSIPSALIPAFARAKNTGGNLQAWRFAWNSLTIFGGLFFVLTILLFFLASPIIRITLPR